MSLYVDISHIAGWSGRLSGIERVEYNLISFYLDEKARFVCWSEERGALIEVGSDKVLKLIQNIDEVQGGTLSPDANIINNNSILRRLKRRLASSASKGALRVDFKMNDELLVLDGLWDNIRYIQSIESASMHVAIHHIVYDMIPIVRPGYVLEFMPPVFRVYMERVLPLCDRIYAISKNSADDTKAFLNSIKAKKYPDILTFRLGDDVMSSKPLKPHGLVSDHAANFILSVGTVEVRKNYGIFLDVYGIAREKKVDLPHLYIVGRKGWLASDFIYVVENDPYYRQNITILDAVNDAGLLWLYENAKYVVCPSYYEGWGLPVAESLAYGKATLSAKGSSLAEAGGEFADFFSPYDPRELYELMVLYEDTQTRRIKEKKIADGYRTVDWESACKEFSKLVMAVRLTENS